MIVRVKITRPENRNYFDVTDGEIVHVDLDDYAAGVLAGEVYANWPAETLKAQAVAARSFGVAKTRQRMNQTYDVDDTSSYQAFKPYNIRKEYTQAAMETAGEILVYDREVALVKYCASNGGRTISGSKPYLPEQDDPWDAVANKGRNGHGIGMSQWGAKVMGDAEFSYEEILAFYYPGTEIVQASLIGTDILNAWLNYLDANIGRGVYVYGAQGQKATEVGDVEAWIDRRSQTTEAAMRAWGYYQEKEAAIGAENIRFFDCSGLAMYFFQNLAGISENDASANTLYGGCEPVAREDLCPGDFVFIDTNGRKSHVGYVGRNGKIIEARGSGYGVEANDFTKRPWTHFGRHKWLKDAIEKSNIAPPADELETPDVDVKRLQVYLLSADIDALPTSGVDGIYGSETDKAVCSLIQRLESVREEFGYGNT